MTQEAEHPNVDAIDFERLAFRTGSNLLLMGGNGGIGSQLAERALSIGARVISLDTDRRAAIAARYRVLPDRRGRASKPSGCVRQGGKLRKPIDGFVFLTGFSPPQRPLMRTSLSDWDEVMTVNLRSAFIAFQLVVPLMRQPGGSIVAMSSGLASNVEPGLGPYSASKAGIIALAKVLAKEVAPGIRVNVVAPGMVDTPFLSGGTGRRSGNEPPKKIEEMPFYQALRSTMLMGRVAVPDDVIGPILFLLGEGSRYMTGQTIHINGGRYMP